jgi:hypothetical protein
MAPYRVIRSGVVPVGIERFEVDAVPNNDCFAFGLRRYAGCGQEKKVDGDQGRNEAENSSL